jgi:hypothetical protein
MVEFAQAALILGEFRPVFKDLLRAIAGDLDVAILLKAPGHAIHDDRFQGIGRIPNRRMINQSSSPGENFNRNRKEPPSILLRFDICSDGGNTRQYYFVSIRQLPEHVSLIDSYA